MNELEELIEVSEMLKLLLEEAKEKEEQAKENIEKYNFEW